LTPGRRREVVAHVQAVHGVSERHGEGLGSFERDGDEHVHIGPGGLFAARE